MATLLNRCASGVVALFYLVRAYSHGGGATTLTVAMFLLLPMACIWFPEALGEYTGTIRLQAMTSSTPAWLVCAGGWLVLVGVPLIGYALSANTLKACAPQTGTAGLAKA
jgi:EamA domain-containing membrane protein RarD